MHIIAISDKKVQQLQNLGFRPADCERALRANGGRMNDAAIWLTSHATPLPLKTVPEKSNDELDITALEVNNT